jgi:hypothetical protein
MDQDHAHFSDSNGVAKPFLDAQVKTDEGRSDERKSKQGENLGSISSVRASKDNKSRPEDMDGARTFSTATAMSGRKRTGSLRQAAMAKMRERIIVTPAVIATPTSTEISDDILSKRSMDAIASSESGFTDRRPSHGKSALSSQAASRDTQNEELRYDPEFLASSMNSSPEGPYVSTTDEDDVTSVPHRTASSSNSSFDYPATVPTMSLTRRRAHRTESRNSRTTVAPPTDSEVEDEEWDYSETEWWGWVILAATWIVFVVVMGSCFGVWSWAWDVGETPYAPPDLEDDDTLPITGYYPALMVCTAVMSWVWVVVAWVGMK